MDFEKRLINLEKFNNVGIVGLTNQLISFSVLNIYNNSNRNILLVTNTLFEANLIFSSLSKLTNNVNLFPMDDFLTSEALAISPELMAIRLSTLNNLCSSGKGIVITNLMGLLRYLPTKSTWKQNNILIKKGLDISRDVLFNKLVNEQFENG